MSVDAAKEMPRYKCHKEVHAFKIDKIVEIAGSAVISGHGNSTIVDPVFMEKHNPQVGGYYVVYADGYKSFSPAEAFEDGYTLID